MPLDYGMDYLFYWLCVSWTYIETFIMTIKEIIKAELKRLKNELIEEGENTMFEQGRISAFEDIDVFIDSLPEEPTWTNEDDYLRTETIQHLEELICIENKERFGIDSKYYQRDIDWLNTLPKKSPEKNV